VRTDKSQQARRFAKAMKASLIFSSTSHSINVQKVCEAVVIAPFGQSLTPACHRSSRLSSRKPLTCVAQSPKLRIRVSHYSCTNIPDKTCRDDIVRNTSGVLLCTNEEAIPQAKHRADDELNDFTNRRGLCRIRLARSSSSSNRYDWDKQWSRR